MNIWKVTEEHCFGEAIVAASSGEEAINMIKNELSSLENQIESSYKVELVEDVIASKRPRIISCFIDY